MRILILADIHANWPALAAIDEPFDVCLVLGDLVDYGPEPEPCIDWIREHAHWVIRGNHDHAVAQNIVAKGTMGYAYLTRETRPLMWERLDQMHVDYLARLPVTETITLDGHVFFRVHATPRDPLNEYLLDDPQQWESRLSHVEADIVCVAHTHRQFVLELNGRKLLNPGSVGQPRDGDPRAGYAIIEEGKIELKRVQYDVERAVELMRQLRISEQAKQATMKLLRAGKAPELDHESTL